MGNSSSKERVALREQLEALDAQCKITTGLKTAIENELAGTSKKLEDRTRDTQSLRDEIKELEEANAKVRQDKLNAITQLQNELSRELQGQLRVAESLTQERNRARKQVEQLEGDLAEIETGSRAAAAAAQGLRERLDKSDKIHEQELEKLRTEIATLRKSNKAQIEELEQKAKDDLAAALEKNTSEVAELKSKTQNDIAELVQNSKLLRTRNVKLEEELATTKASLETSEKERTSLTERVTLLKQSNADSERALAGYQSSDLTSIQTALADRETEVTSLNQQLATLQTQLATESSSHQSLKSSIPTVHADLAAARKQVESLGREHAATQRALTESQAAKEALQQKFNAGISKQSGLFEAFHALKMELAESQQAYRDVVGAQGAGGSVNGIGREQRV